MHGDDATAEVELGGGNMGPVARRGDRVLRASGPWTPSVHRLMHHCRSRGVAEVPRPYGVEPDGREALAYIPGLVPTDPMPPWAWSPEVLRSTTRLLRRFHDASQTADRTGPWRTPPREPAEVICHNDFAPYNLVFDGGHRPVGIIDFDFAGPGPRVWDVAYLAYRLVPLSADRADRFSDAERLGRLSQMLDTYEAGVASGDALSVVVDRLAALAEFSLTAAERLGKPELADHALRYRRDAAYVGSIAT